MPSQRLVKQFLFLVLAGVVTLLFFTSHLRQTQPPTSRTVGDFYQNTVNALEKGKHGAVVDSRGQRVVETHDHDADGDIDEEDQIVAKAMADRLKAAEQRAKDIANAKAPNKPDPPKHIIGVGSSASGQEKKEIAGKEDKEGKPGSKEITDDPELDAEMDRILKKSPVVIFSKSYCPYSRRAKGVLLEKYLIDPTPFVVELDKHPLGPQIQQRLEVMTGRRTVPNVLINGKSIGGSDDIAELDKKNALVDKIKSLGAKKVSVTERFVEDLPKAG
ncbi:thioredoxin-like protein [Podospora didyma]|uniref:Thioredoxin-like protein n=1 Tax=Podospora didyma TaxID=330526 RepID=A0AAE0KAR5_9PEZI|nr:thioredoxin-like protein [Podospora didyma]